MKNLSHKQAHPNFLQHLHSFFGFLAKAAKAKTPNSDLLKNKEKQSKKQKTQEDFSSNEFFLAICHELKTPLNAIIGFSEILQEDLGVSSIKESTELAKEITSAANYLNELIHDLLDVGQVASGNFATDLTKEIDVLDVIKRAVRLNQDYASRRKVILKFEAEKEIKPIKLDAKRMKQVLTNLISNAVKYSPNNSEVRIDVVEVGDENDSRFLEIKISDHGFGMSPEAVKLAFKKYQTVQNPNSNKVDSFGFGLPIVKKLVELQNGKIEVKSTEEKGTEIKLSFRFSLLTKRHHHCAKPEGVCAQVSFG